MLLVGPNVAHIWLGNLVAIQTLLLGGTLLVPVPFSHVPPIAAIMLLAFAFLE